MKQRLSLALAGLFTPALCVLLVCFCSPLQTPLLADPPSGATPLPPPPLTSCTLSSSGTLAVNSNVSVSATNGTVTLTLPAAPFEGAEEFVKLLAYTGTNVLHIVCGGADRLLASGTATGAVMTLSATNEACLFIYSRSGTYWNLSEDHSTQYIQQQVTTGSSAISGSSGVSGIADSLANGASAGAINGSNWATDTSGDFTSYGGNLYVYSGMFPVAWVNTSGFNGRGTNLSGTGTAFTSGRALGLFGNEVDTANLAGMHNDWHCTFTASGASGSLVATGGTWNIIGSGTFATVTSGTTSYTVASGSTTIGSVTMSGSVFNVTSPGCTILSASNYGISSLGYNGVNAYVQAGVNGPWLSTGNGTTPGLWCSGTDDYATFQSLLNTATNSLAGLTVYIDSDFALTNTPIVRGNTRLIGVGGHMWHIAPDVNEHGLMTPLTGPAISSSNIVTQNLWIDCNRPEQSDPRLEGATNASGTATMPNNPTMQSGTTPQWVLGAWVGSARYCDFDLTLVNACTFSFLYSNLYDSRVKLHTIWTDQNPPSTDGTSFGEDMNDDGPHGWGPDANIVFHDCDLMGDDDQTPICPVEETPEGGFVNLVTGRTDYTSIDARRGHGGPVTNITFQNIFLRDAADLERLGGQSATTGSLAWESCIDQIHFINISGTVWKPGATATPDYIGSVSFDGYDVASGTSNNCNFIMLGANAQPDSNTQLNGIRSGVPVYAQPSSLGDPTEETYDFGGSYFNELHGLRQGIVAAFNFNTDTSGSAPYDCSQNGVIMTNSNNVTFITGTQAMTGKEALFTGSNCLCISGSTCPNLAAMPEFTVCWWSYVTGFENYYGGQFVLMDGTTAQVAVASVNGIESNVTCYINASDLAGYYGPGYGNEFGTNHWVFNCVRRRASDGKFEYSLGTPTGMTYSGWTNCGAITGTNPVIYFGYDDTASNGPSYLEGYEDNIGIWKRCLTDHEVNLLWNPGTDGNAPFTPGGGAAGWFWGGRQWPFNY